MIIQYFTLGLGFSCASCSSFAFLHDQYKLGFTLSVVSIVSAIINISMGIMYFVK